MLGDSSNELVLYAPISQDSRFVEFKIQHKTRNQSASWSLVRTVVDCVTPENKKYISEVPLGANYQEKAPRFLRNLTIIDSRAPGTSTFKQEHGDVYFDLLCPLLREMGVGHVYVATGCSTSVAENAASFSSGGTVVILGGDTSVHEFVNALQPMYSKSDNEMRLVVVPTGTGNALATSINLTSPVTAVQRLLLSNSTDFVPLSTFPIHFPIYAELPIVHALVVASWGFHSALVADSDTVEMRSRFSSNPNERFKEAARINLESVKQKYLGEVSGGAKFGPDHSYLLFTTVTHLESSFCISPNSHPPSAKELHMVAIKPFDSIADQQKELMDIMLEAYKEGQHIHDPRVTYTPVNSDVSITVKEQPEQMRRWCIDGHIITSPPGEVLIKPPTHRCKGWNLKVLPGIKA